MSTTSTSQSTIGQMMLMRRGGAVSYTQKVLGIQPANLIAYWPLSETSGTVADNAEGTVARDGTFARNVSAMGTQAGIGDGNTAPTFAGTNGTDYITIPSAVNSTMNKNEFTILTWVRITDTAVWTDGIFRRVLDFSADASNYIRMYRKGSASNEIEVQLNIAGSVISMPIGVTPSPFTDWFMFGVVRSQSGGYVKLVFDGVITDISVSNSTNWNPTFTSLLIGETGELDRPWKGSIAHLAIWNSILTADDVASIANP